MSRLLPPSPQDSPRKPSRILSYRQAQLNGISRSAKWLKLSIPIAFTAAAFVAWYLAWQWQLDWDLRAACMIAAGFSAAWFLALRVLLFSRAAPVWNSLKIVAGGIAVLGCWPLAEVIRNIPYVDWWPPWDWDNALRWAIGLIGAGIVVDAAATIGGRFTRSRD